MKSTIVTGIWDLGRSDLSEGWGRNFSHYIENFKRLLSCNNLNMAIFINPEIEHIVWDIRSRDNTRVYHHKSNDFNGNFFPFYDKVQSIRTNEQWLSQAGWLKDSTQAKMPNYNPMVMSKMFLLHNAKIFNPFNDDYYFWIDGAITNTVHPGYFSHDKVIEKIEDKNPEFIFICFPYETSTEIHGFDIEGMKKYCKSDTVNRVARGGFFGGHKDNISNANNVYYSLLNDTLSEHLMGTEESIFTIMTYLYPDEYKYETIQSNGLIGTFFENVKNNQAFTYNNVHGNRKNTTNKCSVYINTYNAPKQLQMLIDSFEKYEPKFLKKTDITLINNSINDTYNEEYENIVNQYSFRHIKEGNKGVCRSRQWAAEDFNKSTNKYMFFFEDDMLIDLADSKCPFGFNKQITNLFDMLIKIMSKENYDFLKFSFSEFYGHNGMQWSWHNVPGELKREYFGEIAQKPPTNFHNIKSINGIPYADGEIYYSNWPHIIGHEGNQKCFLDTAWEYPYEQTWMSHIYTLTKQNKVRPAILLGSPITHNRVYHYGKEERKEN